MDVDSITVQDMRFNPPNFSAAAVAQAVADQYGLEGKWDSLTGERDQNFRLEARNGCGYVVKVAGPDEAPAVTGFQISALLHLEQVSPRIPVPRIVKTRDADCLGALSDEDGVAHALRVVTYLDGIPYGDGEFPDAQNLQKIGGFMGEVVNALAGFEHTASRHFMPWNLSNGIAVSRELWANAAGDIKTLAAPLLERLRCEVLPRLNACPSQVIHNDGHPYNMLRADSGSPEVVGLIDFGDMVYAPIINELAVTATTFQRRSAGGLGTVKNLLAGFHQVHPLSDAEVTVLWDAITLRCLITVLLSDIKLSISAGGDEDAFEDRAEAFAMLAEVRARDHASTVNELRAVCGYGPGK